MCLSFTSEEFVPQVAFASLWSTQFCLEPSVYSMIVAMVEYKKENITLYLKRRDLNLLLDLEPQAVQDVGWVC